jgi:CHAT domain-containing protein
VATLRTATNRALRSLRSVRTGFLFGHHFSRCVARAEEGARTARYGPEHSRIAGASAAKPGAEALSGLARAFFYAGARSLVVSNWQVETDSAIALMTDTFAALAADPKPSHAQALVTTCNSKRSTVCDRTDSATSTG